MKLLFCFLILLSGITPALAQSKKELLAEVEKLKAEITELKKPKEVNLEDSHEKASYGLGVLMGANAKAQAGDSLDLDAVMVGMTDAFGSKELKMTQEECGMVVQKYIQEIREVKSASAKKEGQTFLEENKKKEGVKVTASGLQYKVIEEGQGKSPGPTDGVTVHYTGKLTDGTVFDSSVERGEPISLSLDGVIAGWTEGIQLMKEGGKLMLYIPYTLGYGERGAGAQIPPYSTLIFEVELLKVN